MLREGGVVAFVTGSGPADGTVVRVVRGSYDPETGRAHG